MVQQGKSVVDYTVTFIQNRTECLLDTSRGESIFARCCRGGGTIVLDVLLLWSASVI